MSKHTLDKTQEGINFFFSVLRNNDTLSKIIIDLKLDVKSPTKKNKNDKMHKKTKGKTTNNVTNKLASLTKLGFLKREGVNKWSKYSINYDGIIDYLHILAGIEDTSNSVERKEKVEELKNQLKTQKDRDSFVKLVDADNPQRRFDTTPQERAYITAYLQHFFNALINKSAKHFNIYEKSLNEVLSAFICGYVYATFDTNSKQKYSMHDLALYYMKNKGLTPSKDLTLFSEMFWREELKK